MLWTYEMLVECCLLCDGHFEIFYVTKSREPLQICRFEMI